MNRIVITLFLIMSLLAGAQNGPNTDFTYGHIQVEIHPEQGLITGQVTYDFTVNSPVDSLLISSRGLEIDSVKIGRQHVEFTTSGNLLILLHAFDTGKFRDLTITYKAHPKNAVYFPGWQTRTLSSDPAVIDGEGGKQVWTQGQGKYSSSWVPGFDDMNEKVRYDLEIVYPKPYELMANGAFRKKEDRGDKILWHYELDKPVSAYLLAFVAGNYHMKMIRSSSGVPLELYYYPSDSSEVKTTYKYTREIFDYLEKEIGVGYPWKIYRQVPVRDFLYAGMENVTLTVFSDSFMTDSIAFNDRNYVNVNAHELAHHWFGDLVTEESGTHHWLQEGFATYYALLAERHLFGDDHYYWKLLNMARQLIRLSEQGQGQALLDPNAGSLTFYEKGAWALHMLREQIGDEAFRAGIREFLESYAYQNSNTAEFLEVIGKHTRVDLQQFRKEWLEAVEFPSEKVMASLKRNEFIRTYLGIQEEEAAPVVVYNEYIAVLKGAYYYPLKQLVVSKAAQWPTPARDSLWLKALGSEDLYVRQGVALAADSIGSSIKTEFENLLKDPSYTTVQEALIKLWIEFPKDRGRYLQQTAGITGFSDHSLRILWLGLALFTPNMDQEVQEYYDELQGYTGPGYQFETRQEAFNMLFEIGGFSRRSLLNLIQGLDHPAWQFRQFCRNMLDRLLLKPEVRIQARTLLSELEEPYSVKVRERLDTITNKSK